MASRIWAVALGAAALAAACVCGCSGGPHAGGGRQPGRRVLPTGSASAGECVSLARLAHGITAQLRGKVAGYVALIGGSRVFASGLARTAAGPPRLAMGPDVLVSVASVGKMFTTIAVLQSLARRHRGTGSRIAPFLPPGLGQGPGGGHHHLR